MTHISELQTGDLVFFNSKGFLSAQIRNIANIEYNHVGVVVKNWEVPFINEAVGRGVIPTPIVDRLQNTESKILVKRPSSHIWVQYQEKQFARRANSVLGKRYDFKGLLINQLILQLFGTWAGGNEKKESNKFYCYEYAAWCYQEYFQWWRINPKDFLESNLFYNLYLIK